MNTVFIFGNGLSVGFNPQLDLGQITQRVLTSLGGRGDALVHLAELSYPDGSTGAVGPDRNNFERLAGPLDRMAEVILAADRLIGNRDLQLTRNLKVVSDELRRLYLEVVGTVLNDINDCLGASWDAMNEFASELRSRHAKSRVTVFNLNYDPILMSSLLETGQYVYDGFRGEGGLNDPLDRWQEIALYHLHGSMAWRYDPARRVYKSRMEVMREDRVYLKWAEGDADIGLPALILSDRKKSAAQVHPFLLFYEELHRLLADAVILVVGGYGFGDYPLNLALSGYLSRASFHRLQIWSPHASARKRDILDRLNLVAPPNRRVQAEQLVVEDVFLPNAEIVTDLPNSMVV